MFFPTTYYSLNLRRVTHLTLLVVTCVCVQADAIQFTVDATALAKARADGDKAQQQQQAASEQATAAKLAAATPPSPPAATGKAGAPLSKEAAMAQAEKNKQALEAAEEEVCLSCGA